MNFHLVTDQYTLLRSIYLSFSYRQFRLFRYRGGHLFQVQSRSPPLYRPPIDCRGVGRGGPVPEVLFLSRRGGGAPFAPHWCGAVGAAVGSSG